jgi:hypothetical protein
MVLLSCSAAARPEVLLSGVPGLLTTCSKLGEKIRVRCSVYARAGWSFALRDGQYRLEKYHAGDERLDRTGQKRPAFAT